VGGAELNVLVAVAQLGLGARWATRLPDNPLGRLLERHARCHGVQLAAEWEAGGRAGLYFIEQAAPPRPAEVLYDRAGSAASRLAPSQLDWAALLDGVGCLHTSGITCALGDGSHAAVLEALEAARERGVTTSFDVNYRAKLWSPEQARPRLREALPRTDVLFASPFDLELLGEGGDPAAAAGRLREAHGIGVVVVSGRSYRGFEAARTSAVAVADRVVSSPAYEAQVVDPFGAGDAGAAGFLAAHLRGEGLERAVDQSARLAALMHSLEGDALVLRDRGREAGAGAGRRILR
jgi:2-dehydro-3-deoxygluconokinase